jgi:multidrug efflux pump subunit AcrA (membrane-fusion protein)
MTGIRSRVVTAGVAALEMNIARLGYAVPVLLLGLTACGSSAGPVNLGATQPPVAMPSDCVTYSSNGGEVACGTAAQAAAQAAAAQATAAQKAAAAAQKAAARKAAAEKKAAAERARAIREARIAAENTPISATKWGEVVRNPDAYQGDIFTISGTVAEYNLSSNSFATVENAAIVATDANGNDFVVECDTSKLGNVQPGQTFTAKVTVQGVVQAQNTVYGGSSELPDFDASTFTITG